MFTALDEVRRQQPMLFGRGRHSIIVSYDPQTDRWVVVCKRGDLRASFIKRRHARAAAKGHGR